MAVQLLEESFKNEISNYYKSLKIVWKTLEKFEKDAKETIAQLKDHLHQAEICQRVDPGFLELPPSICCKRMKSSLLEKIYQKCLFFISQLESQLNVFTSDVLPQLMEPWENCSKIYNDITKEKSSFNYHSDTSTSEIIHLSLLFDRINQVETVFKVRSERMRSTLQIISNSNRDKSECLEYETSANNISIIFDCKIDKESSSVRDILDSYTLGASGITYKSGTVGDLAGFTTRSPHIATEENEDRISQKVGSMMLDAFVWTPEEKLQIEYFLSQAEVFLRSPGSQNISHSNSNESLGSKKSNSKKKQSQEN